MESADLQLNKIQKKITWWKVKNYLLLIICNTWLIKKHFNVNIVDKKLIDNKNCQNIVRKFKNCKFIINLDFQRCWLHFFCWKGESSL